MSAARIAKLESLLERIEQNRTAAPVSAITAAPAPAARAQAKPPEPEPTPQPEAPASAIVTSKPPAAAEPVAPKRTPRHRPTPLEASISSELELRSEPGLEIDVPDDDDEPELTIGEASEELDAQTFSEELEAPTAPIHTRSPEPEPEPDPEPRRIQTAPTTSSAPIAKVVSRPEPRTFDELLDRALALRPR